VEAKVVEFARKFRQYPSKPAAQQGLAEYSDMFMYYAMFQARPASHAVEQFNIANEFRGLGRTQDAILHYRQALEIDPKLAEAHAALAEMLKVEGRVEEAAVHAREAARLKTAAPNSAPARPAPASPVE
jgi:tetratricopeptide (TPR) repeat protein